MDLWLKIALLIFLFTIFFPYHPQPLESFQGHIQEVHPYSGLAPEQFRKFVNNLTLCQQLVYTKPKEANAALGEALEAIRELSLYTQRADQDELAVELNAIANRVALTGEELIQRTSARMGIRFFPKYLNETIPDPLEDASDTFRPGSKKAGAICTSGSCRG
jgi:hypothetical protein